MLIFDVVVFNVVVLSLSNWMEVVLDRGSWKNAEAWE